MITTGCEGCCFLNEKDQHKSCAMRQYTAIKDGIVYAPGYCRMCRSTKWAKKQNTVDPKKLMNLIREEQTLEFDLLVFFDEQIHTTKMLERTLNSDWYSKYSKKNIILDTTGFSKDRKNLALQYLNSREHTVPTVVDSSVEHESVMQRAETIRRVASKVKSNFFMTIPAGNIIVNLEIIAQSVKNIPSRVIYWYCPFCIGSTALVSAEFNYGLFITKPYRALVQSQQVESFTSELRKEELETGIGLAWFCTDSWMA